MSASRSKNSIVRFDEHGYPVVRVDGQEITVRRLLADGDGNTKLRKNKKRGVKSFGLSLSPQKESGIGNTCPHSSPGCAAACLDHQGLASVFTRIRLYRKAKTIVYYRDKDWFFEQLTRELCNTTKRKQLIAVRLNVFSDIPWEKFGIMDTFQDIQFYDYTKNPRRVGLLRQNYWVTFSRSETNEKTAVRLLANCKNVAIVFADSKRPFVGNRSHLQQLPKTWNGFPVIDGDTTDLRFDDIRGRKRGRVIGQRLKAHSHNERKQAIQSGFAIHV